MIREIKVLVIDDSAVMRRAITQILESTGEMKVIGQGRSGKDAIEKIKLLKPDIVTMDIEMPVMDGLTAVRHIMKTTPVPVVMVSSLTTDGAHATMEALNAGAVDFIPKNFAAIMQQNKEFIQEFIDKIKLLARKKLVRTPSANQQDTAAAATADASPTRQHRKGGKGIDLILIGSSTGGPKMLHQIIPQIDGPLSVPVLLVQHLPAHFTKSVADRLNHLSPLHIAQAQDGALFEPGQIQIAPGGQQMLLEKHGDSSYLHVTEAGSETIYKPSVDLTARSVANNFKGRALAIMLTGMGKDGLNGFRQLKKNNAYIIAQSAESAIIYGMPKAIVEAGLADEILHTDQIACRINELGCKSRLQARHPFTH